ncbi:MAG: protocatechuate 3,4-dioxygenase beta subunit [Gammaproteobacteria bacterium]
MDDEQFATGRDWSVHPAFIASDYKSTVLRGPTQPPVKISAGLSERTGPVYGPEIVGPLDNDLTKNAVVNGEPLGERIVVTGRVLDEGGEPVPNMLIEVWQCNSAGRYVHSADAHDAPLDPNFLGAGRCASDADGAYRFYTIKPAAYPWGNHDNAWRPAHIHFSLFGPSLASRIVTQMYFPNDPLLPLDPIYMTVPEKARDRLVATFALNVTEANFALGYEFDIVVRSAQATPAEA